MTIARWALRSALIAVLAGGAGLLVPAAASAEPLGSLTVTPNTGPNIAFPTLTTPKGCPEGTDAYSAFVFGPGLPTDGQLAVVPANRGLSKVGPFAVEMSWSFQDVAADAGITQLKGVYTIELRCIDAFSNIQGTFTGEVDFATPTAFKALGAAAGPAPTPNVTASPEPGAVPSAAASPSGSASPSAPAPSSTSSSSPQSSPSDGAVLVQDGDATDESSSRPWLIAGAIAAGLGALVLAVLAFLRGRANAPTTEDDLEPVGQGGDRSE